MYLPIMGRCGDVWISHPKFKGWSVWNSLRFQVKEIERFNKTVQTVEANTIQVS